MSAPRPKNFQALSDAWNDPQAFARELANYYLELEESGYRERPRDITGSQA